MSRQPEPPASIAKALREFLKRSNGVATLGAEDSMARAVWAALLADGYVNREPNGRVHSVVIPIPLREVPQ